MTGIQLYTFLSTKLVPNQVIHISRTGGYHTFANTINGALVFKIPNNNPKKIFQNDIIAARNIYNINRNTKVDNKWVLQNLGLNWHNDCRVRLLRCLLKMPECLG